MAARFVPETYVPAGLCGSSFRLEPLGPEHNERDYQAWTSSMSHIQNTPGAWRSWPRPMSLEENLKDLEMHAREFSERTSFTYSILDGDDVIGCLYIYPDDTGETDAHVRSWVKESRAEMDIVVWREVGGWLRDDWPFETFRYARRRDPPS